MLISKAEICPSLAPQSTSVDLLTVNLNPLAMPQIRNPMYMPSGTRQQGSFAVISIAGNLLCLTLFIKCFDAYWTSKSEPQRLTYNMKPEVTVTLPTNHPGYKAKLSAKTSEVMPFYF